MVERPSARFRALDPGCGTGTEQVALASAQLLRDSTEGLGSHLRRHGIANQPEGA